MDGGLRAFQHVMDGGDLLAWGLCLFVVTPFATLLHELGHGLLARKLLDGPVAIVIGRTGRRLRFSLAGIEVAVAPGSTLFGPGGGSCVAAGRPSAGEAAAIALAGPAASLLGLIVSLAALTATAGTLHHLAWAAAVANGFGFVANLVPARRCDGRVALDALRRR